MTNNETNASAEAEHSMHTSNAECAAADLWDRDGRCGVCNAYPGERGEDHACETCGTYTLERRDERPVCARCAALLDECDFQCVCKSATGHCTACALVPFVGKPAAEFFAAADNFCACEDRRRCPACGVAELARELERKATATAPCGRCGAPTSGRMYGRPCCGECRAADGLVD